MTLTVSGLIACVAAAAIVLLLAGCTRTVLVTKDGGGLTDLKQDQATCRAQILNRPYTIAFTVNAQGDILDYEQVEQTDILKCLGNKGWKPQ